MVAAYANMSKHQCKHTRKGHKSPHRSSHEETPCVDIECICSVHPGLTVHRVWGMSGMKVEYRGFTAWRVTSPLLRMATAAEHKFRIFSQGLAKKAESFGNRSAPKYYQIIHQSLSFILM